VKGDKLHAKKVRQQYAAAHSYFLGVRSPPMDQPERPTLRLDMLLTAHKLLMMDLCVTPGEFRTVPARCGNRHFVPPEEIAGLMEELVSALAVVLARRDLTMSAKAAWALGHLLAIHPFNDGNGRLGRLLANWVLVTCGLPFAVVLCSSDSQRADYIKVGRSHRFQRNFFFWATLALCPASHTLLCVLGTGLQVFPRGRHDFGARARDLLCHLAGLARVRSIARDDDAHWAAGCSIFSKVLYIVNLFSTYTRALTFENVYEQDAAERETINHIRRTGTEGSCIVCQEPGPNIMTTCCAAPYHITCLTKWLVSGHNSSCCKCRQEISYHPPRLPPALSAAVPVRARRGAALLGADRGGGGGGEGGGGE
jgi:fido (protein-threonine AMPylation protein)